MDKALLVGINKYPGAPLKGCINDVMDAAKLISGPAFKFDSKNIRLLTDARATTAAIRERLQWLVTGLKPGDRILFWYSGHGAQVATRAGSGEVDGMDECICLTGDTLVPLLDGTEKSIESLALAGDPVDVYSMDPQGNVRAGKGILPRCTARNVPVVKVTLDNEQSVRCTPEHLWMLRDGSYRKAVDLTPGTSLMPLYRTAHKYANGLEYEETLNLATGNYVGTHRLVAGDCPPEVQNRATEQGCGVVRHHWNFNSRDNRPDNLVWMTWREHVSLHHGTPEARAASSQRSKTRWADPEYRNQVVVAMSVGCRRREADPRIKRMRSEAAQGQDLTAFRLAGAAANQARLLEAWQDPDYRQAMIASQSVSKPGTAEALRIRWADPEYRERMVAAQKAAAAKRQRDVSGRMVANHKVVSVEDAGQADVYDLTVPGLENFALSAGVFVHNCPVDFDWSDAHMLRDKDFHRIFDAIPPGVKAFWVSDSCHSGDLERDAGALGGRLTRAFPMPEDIQWRNDTAREAGFKIPPSQDLPSIVLVSGCRSDQTSADASFGGRSNGALSYYLLQALKATPTQGMDKVLQTVRKGLLEGNYEQVPQLEGPARLLTHPFLG